MASQKEFEQESAEWSKKEFPCLLIPSLVIPNFNNPHPDHLSIIGENFAHEFTDIGLHKLTTYQELMVRDVIKLANYIIKNSPEITIKNPIYREHITLDHLDWFFIMGLHLIEVYNDYRIIDVLFSIPQFDFVKILLEYKDKPDVRFSQEFISQLISDVENNKYGGNRIKKDILPEILPSLPSLPSLPNLSIPSISSIPSIPYPEDLIKKLESSRGLGGFKLVQLKEMARERKLPVSGTKSQLVDRILNYEKK